MLKKFSHFGTFTSLFILISVIIYYFYSTHWIGCFQNDFQISNYVIDKKEDHHIPSRLISFSESVKTEYTKGYTF